MNYVTFMRDTFGVGATAEANSPYALQISDIARKNRPDEAATQELWKSKYLNESYFFLPDSEAASPSPILTFLHDDLQERNQGHVRGFDLFACTERQASFL